MQLIFQRKNFHKGNKVIIPTGGCTYSIVDHSMYNHYDCEYSHQLKIQMEDIKYQSTLRIYII